MAGAGKRTFIAGEVLTAAQVNDYLMDQAVMRFSGSAARAASITVPTEGMVTYLDDANTLQFYDGAAWVSVISGQLADAAGDLIVGSADNAWGRLPLGSNNNVLTVDTGGSGVAKVKWAALPATPAVIGVAVSDESTSITTGAAKVTLRMPFAMTVTAVRASLSTASSSGNPTFDINENGTSILGTKLSIDANEKTSTTAAAPATITDANLADDAEITIDIDTAGTGAKGAKVYIIGTLA